MIGNGSGAASSGNYNITMGNDITVSTGSYNVFIGRSAAGQAMTPGGYNTGVGPYSLWKMTSGADNIGLGAYGGHYITDGEKNVCLGRESGGSGHTGSLTTGDKNILIGHMTVPSAADGDYQIVMATSDDTDANRYPGTAGKGDSTGFIDPNQGAMYQGNNATAWTATSDRRIKKNIVDSTIGLAEINQIQIRNFEYRLKEEVDAELPSSAAIAKEGIQTGVIAQEVMDILPDIIEQETTGAYSVNPDNVTWHLVKAIQELSAEVEELKAKIEE
jgi:hypothetical protein